MTNELRRVKIYKREMNTHKDVPFEESFENIEDGYGFFHQFGLREEADRDVYMISVSTAIVERDNGEVIMVDPDLIVFVKDES